MSETRGIFGLTEAVDQKLDNEWVPLDQVWHGNTRFSDGKGLQALPDAGYITGGYASPQPGVRTTRVKLSTDTSSYTPSANMTSVRQNFATTSSLTTAYIAGGGPGSQSNAQKIPYADDTTVFLPSVNIQPRSEVGGNGTSDNGYFSGGAPSAKSFTSRLQYSNDSASLVPGAYLATARRYMDRNTLGNVTHGHCTGGSDSGGTTLSSSDRLTYSTETTAALPGANLVDSVPNYSRFLGVGSNTSGYAVNFNGTVQKITYSSGTFAINPGAALGHTRSNATGFGGNGAGYITGGENPAVSPSFLTSMLKLSYSTDTTSTLPSGANLTGFKYSGSNGMSPFDTGNEDRQPPTETPSSTIFAQGPAFGYFGGGQPGPRSTIDKISYATDSGSAIPSTLISARYGLGAVASTSGAYFGGGYSPGSFERTLVDKTTFSTDATARIPGANLSDARYNLTAVGNDTKGYFAGGNYQSTYKNRVDKLTFSNNTASASPSSSLSESRRQLGSVGNTTAGYFGGGRNSSTQSSVLDKLTYSNDTTARLPSANFDTGRQELQAAGNSTHGYFGNGPSGPGSSDNKFHKITYASDTNALLPALEWSERRQYAASSSPSIGYYAGGVPSRSTVEKLDFSTETISASTTAFLSQEKYALAGASGQSNGIGLVDNIV